MKKMKNMQEINETSEAPSYYSANKIILLEAIMNQLGLTESDLERETSWIRSKIRESNINKILS
jgi:hypothetical protein